MTMDAPPLNEFFPAQRERRPPGDAGGAGFVLTSEGRASLGKQPDPGTHVAG